MTRSGHAAFTALLVLAVLVLGTLLLLALRQNTQLKAQLAAFAVAPSLPDRALRVGAAVTPLELHRPDGTPYSLNFGTDQPPTLLLLVAATCHYCELAAPQWESVLEAAAPPSLRVVAIDADARPGGPCKQFGPRLPAFAATDPLNTWLVNVPTAPAALLIDPSGVVLRTWYGEATPQNLNELAAALADLAPAPSVPTQPTPSPKNTTPGVSAPAS